MSHVKTTFAFPGWSVNNGPNKLSFKKVTQWGDNLYKKYDGAWKGASIVTFNATDLPDTSKITNFNSSWSQCSSINVFPELNTLSGVDFSFAWEGCTSLSAFPSIETKNAKSIKGSWANCKQLKTFPKLNLSKCEDYSYAWYNCNTLTDLPRLSTQTGTNFWQFVEGCYNLSSAPLQGTKEHHSFANCALQRPALIEIFKGLANVIYNPKTINITNNPGLSDLQYEDYYIAWWKGWNVIPFVCNEISLENYTCIELETCQDGIIPVLEREDKIRTPVNFLCLDNSPGNIPTGMPPATLPPTPTPTSTPAATPTPVPTPTPTSTPLLLIPSQQNSFILSHPSSPPFISPTLILNPNQQTSFALSHPPPLLPAIVPSILSINPLQQNSFALSNPSAAPASPTSINLNPITQNSFALSNPPGLIPAAVLPSIISLNLQQQNSLSLSHPSQASNLNTGLIALNFNSERYSMSLSVPAIFSNLNASNIQISQANGQNNSIALSHPI